MSAENNGWTWSADYEDWYRAERLADGTWNYIFSKDSGSSATYSQSTPRNIGEIVGQDDDDEDEEEEEYGNEAGDGSRHTLGSQHAQYAYGPSTSAGDENLGAGMAALAIGQSTQPQSTGYSPYGGNYQTAASSRTASGYTGYYQQSSSSSWPTTHQYAQAHPHTAPTIYTTSGSSARKGKQVEQYHTAQPVAKEENTDDVDEEVETTVGRPHGLLRGTTGVYEKLDPSFKRVDDHWTFFIPGRVFSTLWWESSGVKREGPSLVQYGEEAFAKVYRFIVVRAKPKEYYSKCIQISTHGGRATTKKGLNQEEHTIVYTGNEVPPKIKGETKLRKDAINIVPINPAEKLDALSRVNLAKTYPVEHNVKVKEVGKVHAAHLKKLIGYWKNLTHT